MGAERTLRLLLAIEAIADLVFGAVLIAAPDALASVYGVTLEPGGVFFARFGGGALVGWGVTVWLARSFADGPGRRAIIRGLFAGSSLGFVVTLWHQVQGTTGVLGWSNVALTLLFAIAWGYYSYRYSGPLDA